MEREHGHLLARIHIDSVMIRAPFLTQKGEKWGMLFPRFSFSTLQTVRFLPK